MKKVFAACTKNNGMGIFASQDIKKGEEITFDYSSTEADPYWKMKCKCGSFNCRKIINGEAEWK